MITMHQNTEVRDIKIGHAWISDSNEPRVAIDLGSSWMALTSPADARALIAAGTGALQAFEDLECKMVEREAAEADEREAATEAGR